MALDRRLQPQLLPVSGLNAGIRGKMFDVFASYYDDVSRAQFENDLSEKDSVLLLHDAQGVLRGFTTLQHWDEDFAGEKLLVVFSGDTIIETDFWGSQALAFGWLKHAGELHRVSPNRRLFWFLIVKGHRTYRYLPTFAFDFFPDWRKPAEGYLSALAQQLAHRKFGEFYDAGLGVIRFSHSRGRLTEAWAVPSSRERKRADVRFFLDRNPGYRRGDELVCVSEVCASNLKPFARRIFLEGLGN